MDKEFLLWNLSLNDAFTTQLTAQVVSIALIVAVICLIISTGWNYLQNGFKQFVSDDNSFKFPDYEQLGRGIIIILLISAYVPCMKVVVGSIDAINEATSMNASASATYDKIVNNFMNYQNGDADSTMIDAVMAEGQDAESGVSAELAESVAQNVEQPETGFWGKVSKALETIVMMLHPQTMVTLGLHAIFSLLFGIVKIIVLGIAVLMVKVLVILGPLALAFSILPVFSKQMETWFGTLVNTAMVFTTINILDAIVAQAFVHIFNPAKSNAEFAMMQSELLALDLVLLVLYVSSFWLTSKIVGRGDAGRVISKLVGTAVAAAGIAMSGGASAAASGSGSIGNAASAGKGLIEGGGDE